MAALFLETNDFNIQEVEYLDKYSCCEHDLLFGQFIYMYDVISSNGSRKRYKYMNLKHK